MKLTILTPTYNRGGGTAATVRLIEKANMQRF